MGTRHFNPSIISRAQRILNSKQGDFLSDNVEGPIAVIPIEPRTDIVRSQVISNATSGTIFTSDANKTTYIDGACLSFVKDATSTATSISIKARLINEDSGTFRDILIAATLTLTPERDSMTVQFKYPILISPGSAITLNADSATGNIRARGIVYIHTEETTVQ